MNHASKAFITGYGYGNGNDARLPALYGMQASRPVSFIGYGRRPDVTGRRNRNLPA